MSRGSVLFYTGSVIHSGGENGSSEDRIALNLTYNNAWLRQEENQHLTCPPPRRTHKSAYSDGEHASESVE